MVSFHIANPHGVLPPVEGDLYLVFWLIALQTNMKINDGDQDLWSRLGWLEVSVPSYMMYHINPSDILLRDSISLVSLLDRDESETSPFILYTRVVHSNGFLTFCAMSGETGSRFKEASYGTEGMRGILSTHIIT